MKIHYYNDDLISICDNKHLTIDEIFLEIQKKFPNAGRSSIYRNIETLVKKWDIRKLEWIWKKAYFEKNKENHIHLIDKNTWKIFDLDINNISLPNIPKNFKIWNMDIKIFGEFV